MTFTYDFDQIIDRRRTESLKWQRYGEDVLPLWVADTDFVAPEPVLRELRERVEHGIFGYAVEPPELREVFVQRLLDLYGWVVSPEAMLFLPGVVTGFNVACRAFAEAGEGTVVQTPVYPPLIKVQGNFDLVLENMELIERDDHYQIDMDVFESTISDRTRLFLLCNPHNPVGRVFNRDELTRMAEICLRKNLIICSDEIHCDVLLYGHRHIPIAALDPAIADRTVTLMAPSKVYNIAGLGCSVAIIQNPNLRARYAAAKAGIVSGVNLMGYLAAMSAYRDGQEWLDQMLDYLQGNCDFLIQYVAEKLPGIRMCKPEGTFLAWLDCRGAGIRDNPFRFFLEQAKVALNDGPSFGPGGNGFVRLNFGCPRAILEEALERMRAALLSTNRAVNE